MSSHVFGRLRSTQWPTATHSIRLSGITAIAAATAGSATPLCQTDESQQGDTKTQLLIAMTTVTTGASIAAAAAPALCAVHCAAMPLLAVLLPSLQHLSGRKFGGVCMHALGRRMAFYFVVPCGLISNAIGYPQHESPAVTGASLAGISLITAAAAWTAVRPYKLCVNLTGCACMLGSSYVGNRIAMESGRSCNGCSDCSGASSR